MLFLILNTECRLPGAARRAFTLVELLVVAGMFVVLLSVFAPYALSLRESRNRVLCADNLRAIGQSLRTYAYANRGLFPRTPYDPDHNANGFTAFTGPDCDDPFVDNAAVKPNDVTASLWLLVRTQKLSTSVFICPSTADRRDLLTDDHGNKTTEEQRGNFRSAANLSYSYAHPFSSTPDYRLSDTRPGYFVLLADKNPGQSGGSDVAATVPANSPLKLDRVNSHNHNRAGQNVLYASGEVVFTSSPYIGAGYTKSKPLSGDNIYTALRPAPLEGQKPPANDPGSLGETVGPAWENDSYLVPFEK